MNKRLILIIAGLVSVVLIAISVLVQQVNPTGTLELSIIPADATVTIDKQTPAKAGTNRISAGKHDVAFSREGFQSKTISVTITKGQTTTEVVALDVTSYVGDEYLAKHPEQVAKKEGAAGRAIEAQGEKTTQNNPLIQVLPYTGNGFNITPGESLKNPDDPSAIGIYIFANDQAAKNKALGWIKSQGYDPNAYEIIYDLEVEGE